ncbi:hypothetical protein [Micrococcus endophyticus]|uniref:hypothetical protein n=1 Tax=Micrococcus endophyticus TaxID=455343 RepID=UPI001622B4A4|nr:hypothetical protein [Micrococcus endophyticus]
MVALPEPEYLVRVGELAYAVSSLEWTMLGDLHRLAPGLPEGLTLSDLEARTTGGIARRLRQHAEHMSPGPLQVYVATAAEALATAAALRNDVLHARPATHPAQGQRLYRAAAEGQRPTGHRFWIDDAWLDEAVVRLNEQVRAAAHRPAIGSGIGDARGARARRGVGRARRWPRYRMPCFDDTEVPLTGDERAHVGDLGGILGRPPEEGRLVHHHNADRDFVALCRG